MDSKRIIQSALIVALFGLLVGCFQNESDQIFQPSDELSCWIGKYEYTSFSNPGSLKQKAVHYQLTIEMSDEYYYAIFSMDGWQTYYKAQATIVGNCDEISVIFDEYLAGSGWTFADSLTSSQDRFKIGDLLFLMEKTESGITTKLSEELAFFVHDVDLQYVKNTTASLS